MLVACNIQNEFVNVCTMYVRKNVNEKRITSSMKQTRK